MSIASSSDFGDTKQNQNFIIKEHGPSYLWYNLKILRNKVKTFLSTPQYTAHSVI